MTKKPIKPTKTSKTSKTSKITTKKNRNLVGGKFETISGPGYTKECEEPRKMCSKDDVNFALCVEKDADCSNSEYDFHYNPETRMIERNTMSVARFIIRPNAELSESQKRKFKEDVLRQEEIGRLKSYVPEFAPTSCFVQKKQPITREYEIVREALPEIFSIVTQNALGLYFGQHEEELDLTDEKDRKNKAVLSIMRLRTAYFRKFLMETAYPDFLCFQEMTPEFFRFLYQDSEVMKREYPYFYPNEEDFANLTSQGANATVMLISKHPALKQTTYMLQGNSNYYNALGVYEFKQLVIFNVYLQAGSPFSPGLKYNWENASRCRRQQLMFIKSLIDSYGTEKAIVVLGDFNFELNSIHYDGTPDDTDNWSELVFLKALGLSDSFKSLHPEDPGFTENTDVNTLRYLGKLEEKKLRYDGIFCNSKLTAQRSVVVNNRPLKLSEEKLKREENFPELDLPGMPFDADRINDAYELALVFKPGNDQESIQKLVDYKEKKGLNDGYELFISDHFGVLTTFKFVTEPEGGSSRRKKIITKKMRKQRTTNKSKHRSKR